ncbi:MAG: chloride channel protein [Deltaproteobacteria bacterium]|nr:chloride channel protein [Deltaproteobacteria bacterium]
MARQVVCVGHALAVEEGVRKQGAKGRAAMSEPPSTSPGTDATREDRVVDFLRGMGSRLRAHRLTQAAPFWLAATGTGLIAVLYAHAYSAAVATAQSLLQAHPYALLAVSPVCFLAGWWLVQRFAPAASGSGIPQVMTLLELDPVANDAAFNRMVGWRVLVVKILSSLCCALGGGAIGREGPMIQIAASLFHAVGGAFRRFIPAPNHHGWIVTGGAAGIAAAFNTPLGGIVFAVEELASQGFNKFKTHLITAVIISGMVAQTFLGPYLLFGYPAVGELGPTLFIGFAVLVGVVAGFGGGVFGKVLVLASARLRALPLARRATFAAACGVVVALVAMVQGPGVLGGGVELVKEFLFVPERHATPALLVTRWVTTVVSYLAGCAGGVFAPSLALGASVGSVLEGWLTSGNANLMILLGMVAFLAGVTRAPFTAFVLVVEMTDRHAAIFPLMLAAISGALAAHVVDPVSFYHRQRRVFAAWFKDAILDSRPEMRGVLVSQAMTRNPVTLAPATPLAEVMHVANQTGHAVFPVVSVEGRLVGLVAMADVRHHLEDASVLPLVVAGDIMRTHLVTVVDGDTLETGLKRLMTSKLNAIPVVAGEDPHRLVGCLTEGDIVKALASRGSRPPTGEFPAVQAR